MTRSSLNRHLAVTVGLLLATVALFEFTNLDLLLQDRFYDFGMKRWLLDREDAVLAFIFYGGIKKLLIAFAVAILATLVFFRKRPWVQHYQKGLLVVLLASICVPVVVGALKAVTNTPCPRNIAHYGGNYPDVKLFSSYPEGFKQECNIRCWPAGHASGGFALLSLFFLFKSPANRKKAALGALCVGWGMGGYKMLIGDHFLSHTLVTMFLAWAIVLLLYLAVQRWGGQNSVASD